MEEGELPPELQEVAGPPVSASLAAPHFCSPACGPCSPSHPCCVVCRHAAPVSTNGDRRRSAGSAPATTACCRRRRTAADRGLARPWAAQPTLAHLRAGASRHLEEASRRPAEVHPRRREEASRRRAGGPHRHRASGSCRRLVGCRRRAAGRHHGQGCPRHVGRHPLAAGPRRRPTRARPATAAAAGQPRPVAGHHRWEGCRPCGRCQLRTRQRAMHGRWRTWRRASSR